MILWQDLNFWTAVGEVGIGILVGGAVGLMVKRMNRMAGPPVPGHTRLCPGCGMPSLRRTRVTLPRRVISQFTRQWPYACSRCNWPHAPAERPSRKIVFSRSNSSSALDPAILEFPISADPAAKSDLAADLVLQTEAGPKPISKPRPAAQAQPILKPRPAIDVAPAAGVKPAADVMPAVEAKPAPAPRPAAAPKPAVDLKPAAAATIDSAQPSTRVTPKDDATLVKESVYQFIALINAGDVTTRANCFLSEFTSFGIEGGPLKSNRFDGRISGPTPTFDLRCRDLRVYIYKDTAIATAYLIGTITNTNGAPVRVTGRSSWVHLRQNGEWKIAHSHLSPLTPEL